MRYWVSLEWSEVGEWRKVTLGGGVPSVDDRKDSAASLLEMVAIEEL
jgi:hypothetical protein